MNLRCYLNSASLSLVERTRLEERPGWRSLWGKPHPLSLFPNNNFAFIALSRDGPNFWPSETQALVHILLHIRVRNVARVPFPKLGTAANAPEIVQHPGSERQRRNRHVAAAAVEPAFGRSYLTTEI